MLQFLKNWTLPIAMTIGAIGYPFFMLLAPITPVLIFLMLLLTFCKISYKDLKISTMHIWLLTIQIVGSLLAYFLLSQFNEIVAQGALICILAPTAAGAVVITVKLGGNGASVTSHILLANIAVAIAAPLLFPLIEPHPGIGFGQAMLIILGKVFPLLICPMLTAWLLKAIVPKFHARLLQYHDLSFYLWAFSLAIVTAQTLNSLIHSTADTKTEILIALAALMACCLQFFFGRKIGARYGDRVSGGQEMGQKNTILAIWMAYTYLNPLSAVGPGSYVLWQNIINSWQLWRKRRKDSSI